MHSFSLLGRLGSVVVLIAIVLSVQCAPIPTGPGDGAPSSSTSMNILRRPVPIRQDPPKLSHSAFGPPVEHHDDHLAHFAGVAPEEVRRQQAAKAADAARAAKERKEWADWAERETKAAEEKKKAAASHHPQQPSQFSHSALPRTNTDQNGRGRSSQAFEGFSYPNFLETKRASPPPPTPPPKDHTPHGYGHGQHPASGSAPNRPSTPQQAHRPPRISLTISEPSPIDPTRPRTPYSPVSPLSAGLASGHHAFQFPAQGAHRPPLPPPPVQHQQPQQEVKKKKSGWLRAGLNALKPSSSSDAKKKKK